MPCCLRTSLLPWLPPHLRGGMRQSVLPHRALEGPGLGDCGPTAFLFGDAHFSDQGVVVFYEIPRIQHVNTTSCSTDLGVFLEGRWCTRWRRHPCWKPPVPPSSILAEPDGVRYPLSRVVSPQHQGLRTMVVTSFSWLVTVQRGLVTQFWPIKDERKSAGGFRRRLLHD